MMEKLRTIKELLVFLGERKLWWLVPMVVAFLLFGFLILFVGSSPLAPLIYPLF